MSRDPAARQEAVTEMLAAVHLAPELLDRYPGRLSGGQRQRVAIACAFLPKPELVVCDEITSGQDVSIQAAILTTIADMQRRYGTAVLFISHDLGVVRSIADAVYVLRRGEIVEHGPSEDLFQHPKHAYTRELLTAAPVLGSHGSPAGISSNTTAERATSAEGAGEP
jgi:peptide/nickel transport system ATP-binding protein